VCHAGVRIDMTVPVVMLYHWASDEVIQMCFYLPEKYQHSTPTPLDESVYLTIEPGTTVAARIFPGYPSRLQWEIQAEKLKHALQSEGQDSVFDLSYYYRAVYDAPWKLFHRRNEVIVMMKNKQ
jgi:hypothetical protein